MNKKIIANVGGNPVYEYEIDDMIAAYSQRGQNFNTPEGRESILEQVISKKLLLLDAQKNLLEHNAEFKAQLKSVKEEMLANFNLQKAIEKITVTDDEAKAYYEENKAQFEKGESVCASHILVDSEDKAKALKTDIESGAISFEDAARANSTCPSRASGGALGEFTKGQMVPEFDEAAFSMDINVVSEPVKTQFGYHLIKVTAKNPAGTMDFEDVKDQIKNVVINTKRQKAVQSKINQLKILYPVDKM